MLAKGVKYIYSFILGKDKRAEPNPLSLNGLFFSEDKLGLNFLVYKQVIASARLLTSTSCVGSF